MRSRLPWICLALILLAGAALHADRALHPTSSYQSADERSYGKLGYQIAERGLYGDGTFIDPLHWPPGYPMLLAAAHELVPDDDARETYDLASGYAAQALVGVLTVLALFVLVRLLAGLWPAVVAAGLYALYPPAILQTGEQVSEPLGALMMLVFAIGLTLAVRRGAWWWWALAGTLLGGVILVRTDYLLLPFALAGGIAVALRFWRRPRRALVPAAALLAGALVALTPWTVYATKRADEFVPVTRGGGAALWVGTYLPGDGRTVGVKRALGAEVKAAKPELRRYSDFDLPAAEVLDYVARTERPGLDRNAALQAEGRENLVEYGLGDPIDFGLMMADKGWRMWSKYSRGGARHTSPVFRGWHILLVGLSLVGLVLGLRRRRDGVLAAIALVLAYATLLHMVVVSQARYNAPLMPLLIAGGVMGWTIWRRERSPAAGSESRPPPVTRPEPVAA